MSIRTARVAEEIQKVLGERLIRGLRDPLPGFVTIRGVEVTSDFAHAKVFVSVFGSDADKAGAIAGLRQQRGALRYEVGQKVRLRNTPELDFVLDESAERAARVHHLLDEIKAGHVVSDDDVAPTASPPVVRDPGGTQVRTARAPFSSASSADGGASDRPRAAPRGNKTSPKRASKTAVSSSTRPSGRAGNRPRSRG